MTFFDEMHGRKLRMPEPDAALQGRETPLKVDGQHYVNNHGIFPPFLSDVETTYFGMGCYWGAERLFWELDGVYSTAVGYAGGYTKNPTYEEVCTGMTGHTEAVMVAFHPTRISYKEILKTFWENHDPTQGMRQGNDVGTQYRSVIFCSSEKQLAEAKNSREVFLQSLAAKGLGDITTNIDMAPEFYYAETYHQQYLAKNPNGYCGLAGTGACMPTEI